MRNDKAYIKHIYDTIIDLEGFTKDATLTDFLKDTEKQYAVIRAFEVIGEASKNISAEFKKKHPGVPWTKMSAMRDNLIHGYFGVNLELVWSTVKVNIPEIKNRIKALKAR
ncbi:MAG: DUF86 domain-containing protein [Candidatus Altiarchaeota archaeon]